MKNKKICVVGAGMWGLNHIKTLNVLGSLGGVVEISQNRIEKIKYNFPNCSIFANLNELQDTLIGPAFAVSLLSFFYSIIFCVIFKLSIYFIEDKKE